MQWNTIWSHSRIIEFFYRLYPKFKLPMMQLVLCRTRDGKVVWFSTLRKILQFHHWPCWQHCIRWIFQSIVYTLHQSKVSTYVSFLCHRLPLPSISHLSPRILLRDVWSEKDGIDKIYLHLFSSPEPKTTCSQIEKLTLAKIYQLCVSGSIQIKIDHLWDITMGSQTTDITYIAVVFHYYVTIQRVQVMLDVFSIVRNTNTDSNNLHDDVK